LERGCGESLLGQASPAIRRLDGLDHPVTADQGKRCFMARRLVESCARFVRVEAPVRGLWDQHGNLKRGIEEIAAKVDQPSAGLIRDLKLGGLLEETILIWSGEFGRLPAPGTTTVAATIGTPSASSPGRLLRGVRLRGDRGEGRPCGPSGPAGSVVTV